MSCLGCAPVLPVASAAAMLGLSRRQLPVLVADGILVRLSRRVLIGCCTLKRARTDTRLHHEVRLRRLLIEYEDSVGSHSSSAITLGLPVLDMPDLATGTRARGAWRGGDWSRVRIAPIAAEQVVIVDGLRVFKVARTVIDIARSDSLQAAAVTGDAALRRGLPVDELKAVLDFLIAQRLDVARARRVADFLDPRSESALESLSRAIFHERNVEPPEPQVWRRGADGRWYRVDFYWKRRRLIGEADGLVKYDGDIAAEVLGAEKLRQETLVEAGDNMVRWTNAQMRYATDETVGRVLRHLR